MQGSHFLVGSGLTAEVHVARYLGPVPHDSSYYAKCMLGGALACGLTHAGITPLDVAKCNMQVCPASTFANYFSTKSR